MLPIRHIHDPEGYGCTIAACAMVAGVDYHTFRKTVFPKTSKRYSSLPWRRTYTYVTPHYGIYFYQAVNALKKLGCDVLLTKHPEKYIAKHRIVLGGYFDTHSEYDCSYAHCVAWCPITMKFYDPCALNANDVAFIAPAQEYVDDFHRAKKDWPAIVLLKGHRI